MWLLSPSGLFLPLLHIPRALRTCLAGSETGKKLKNRVSI